MPYTPNQPLWYAWLTTVSNSTPVARIAEVFWLRPDKAPDTSRVSYAGNKFGLVAPNSHLFDNPADARRDLIQQITDAANAIELQHKTLWSALAELDRTAIIDWPKLGKSTAPVKVVTADPLVTPLKPAIVDPVATLKQDIIAQAQGNRRQARLIAHAERAARNNTAALIPATPDQMRKIDAKILPEVLELPRTPKEAIPPATLEQQPPPIDPTATRPVASGPDKAGFGPGKRPKI